MAEHNSRTATKFVLRFDDDSMHAEAKAAAKADHIALNSFILQAVEEKLRRKVRLDRLLSMLEKSVKKA